MPSVGIFRIVFPLPSEKFILEQMRFLATYQPQVMCRTYEAPDALPAMALGTPTHRRFRQMAWTLTRSPFFFPMKSLSDLSLIHAHFGPDGVMALPLAESLGIPLVTTFHGGDITVRRQHFEKSRRPTERWWARRESALIQRGTLFIAVSNFIRQRLVDRGYPQERILQHYIGVDTERFVRSPVPAPSRYVLCVGRHTVKKGIDTLLCAWAQVAKRHPDVKLVQVGAGDATAQYLQLVKQLGIEDRVVFMGLQNHASVLQLMAQAEVFALTSQTADIGDSEALGIVFNEASACGVPVISTLHGGIPEAVIHGETGLLSPERDARSIAEHLDAVLTDRALGIRLGRRGRELVCDTFDIRKQTRILEDAYRGLGVRG